MTSNRARPHKYAELVWVTILCASCLILTSPVFAQAEGEGDGEGEEMPAKNSAGFFVGFTGEDRRNRGLAIGIEGTHFFSESFGVGGVLEYTFGDIDALVGAVPLVYRTGKWKAYAGPGFEGGDAAKGAEFLVRVGTEYGFEVGSIEIAPQFNLDFVDGDTVVVIGVLFARPF